jgi:hypothetical protein
MATMSSNEALPSFYSHVAQLFKEKRAFKEQSNFARLAVSAANTDGVSWVYVYLHDKELIAFARPRRGSSLVLY